MVRSNPLCAFVESQMSLASSLHVVVQQFLEAVVHSILYHRNVYPPESFDRTQLYGMVVHRNRHPLVMDYIREVATKATASGHTLGEVRILIFNGNGDVGNDGDWEDSGDGGDDRTLRPEGWEKRGEMKENSPEGRELYRLVFSALSTLPDEDTRDAQDANTDPENDRQAEKRKWYRMQDDFKATLLRLEVLCRAQSVPGDGDPDALTSRTFRMQLVTRPDADRAEDNGDWMVIQRPAAPLGPRRATPVHTVRLAEGTSVSIRME